MPIRFDDEETQAALAEAGRLMRERMDPEELEFLIGMTYRLGVMCAILESGGSLDADTLAHVLYEQKGHVVPVEEMRRIVEEFMPVLIEEGMVDPNRGLTEQGLALAVQHLEMLQNDGQPGVVVQ